MKTSNLILSLITIFFFGSIVGTAMILKQEFEKMDFDDPFYGLSRNELSPFSAIQLEGNTYRGRIDIRPGDKHEFLHPINLDIFDWEVRQDTLFLNYSGESWVGSAGLVYILAPSISWVASKEFECRVHGWETEHMLVSYTGPRGFVTFTENKFEKFSATVLNEGALRLENGNEIGSAEINVEDTSNLVIETSRVNTITMNAGPQARVQLPGALLEKIRK